MYDILYNVVCIVTVSNNKYNVYFIKCECTIILLSHQKKNQNNFISVVDVVIGFEIRIAYAHEN